MQQYVNCNKNITPFGKDQEPTAQVQRLLTFPTSSQGTVPHEVLGFDKWIALWLSQDVA